MPWAYEENPTLGIVEVAYTGPITQPELTESVSKLIALETERSMNRFLVDATAMELDPSLSLGDFFGIPTEQYVDEKADRQGRVALLLPTCPIARQAVQFYETVCQNRGWLVKAVSSREEAIAYLT